MDSNEFTCVRFGVCDSECVQLKIGMSLTFACLESETSEWRILLEDDLTQEVCSFAGPECAHGRTYVISARNRWIDWKIHNQFICRFIHGSSEWRWALAMNHCARVLIDAVSLLGVLIEPSYSSSVQFFTYFALFIRKYTYTIHALRRWKCTHFYIGCGVVDTIHLWLQSNCVETPVHFAQYPLVLRFKSAFVFINRNAHWVALCILPI